MARQLVALRRAISGTTDRATQAGFLITYLVILGALAHRLPLFQHEAQIIGQALIARDATQPYSLVAGWVLQLSDALMPETLSGRIPFILSSFLGSALCLRIAKQMGTGPVVANLGLAWALSSLLLLAGGALVGPGPLAMLGVSLFLLSVGRLLSKDTRENWGLVAATGLGVTAVLPEMSAAVLGLIGLPFLVPGCRKWPLRVEFWILLCTALLLAVATARVNGMTLLWPMLNLNAPSGWSSLWVLGLVMPPVIMACVFGMARPPRHMSIHPMRAVVFVAGLSLLASFLASGLKPEVLMASLPILTLQAAHAIETRSDKLAAWLGEHCLPVSALAMLGALYLWASASPLLMHNAPVFREASGWTAMSLELEALSRQNNLGWIAADTPGHAAMIRPHLNGRLPVAVAGVISKIDCRRAGLFVAKAHATKSAPTEFRPIIRMQDGHARGIYVVSVIQKPERIGLCPKS